MKTKSATKEPATIKMPENFERFAKALMAVPKTELDKELAKHERKKTNTSKVRSRSKTS